jgi:beta-glucuronidase
MRQTLDLAGLWHGELTLNPDLDVDAPDVIDGSFHLPLPWNQQIEHHRWPRHEQELSGIVEPVQNQNFRNVQRKFAEGTMVYSTSLALPTLDGRRAFIVFEGSNYRTSVDVNGSEVGHHEGGHIGFEFEITDALRDGSNDVEITVDNPRRKDACPQEQFNWQNYGGIYRPFRIEWRPAVFVASCSVFPGRNESGWFVDLTVQFSDPVDGELSVAMQSGDCTADAVYSVDGRTLQQRIPVESPLLWTIGRGGMSQIRCSMTTDRTPCDEVSVDFGFRTVALRDGRIELNGSPVRILGAGLHEQHPTFGNALPGWQADHDIQLMKNCGLNTVRAAHYPHAQSFYDACDRAGMLCFAELPCWQFNEYHFSNTEVNEFCVNYATAMVQQLGHHPSIIGWIPQNESHTFEDGAVDFFRRITDAFRAEDSTRILLAAESEVRPPEHLAFDKDFLVDPVCESPPTHELMDVLGINNYAGWYAEKADFLPKTLDHIHKQLPDTPLILSEFGAEGILGQRSLTMEKWTEDYQAELICHHVQAVLDRDYMAGFLIWLFVDYEASSIGIRGINAKGLVDEFRRPKLAYDKLQTLLKHHTQTELESTD